MPRRRVARDLGIECRRQILVLDSDCLAGLFGDCDTVGDDGGDPLTDEPDCAFQDATLVGVVGAVVMARGGERDRRTRAWRVR